MRILWTGGLLATLLAAQGDAQPMPTLAWEGCWRADTSATTTGSGVTRCVWSADGATQWADFGTQQRVLDRGRIGRLDPTDTTCQYVGELSTDADHPWVRLSGVRGCGRLGEVQDDRVWVMTSPTRWTELQHIAIGQGARYIPVQWQAVTDPGRWPDIAAAAILPKWPLIQQARLQTPALRLDDIAVAERLLGTSNTMMLVTLGIRPQSLDAGDLRALKRQGVSPMVMDAIIAARYPERLVLAPVSGRGWETGELRVVDLEQVRAEGYRRGLREGEWRGFAQAQSALFGWGAGWGPGWGRLGWDPFWSMRWGGAWGPWANFWGPGVWFDPWNRWGNGWVGNGWGPGWGPGRPIGPLPPPVYGGGGGNAGNRPVARPGGYDSRPSAGGGGRATSGGYVSPSGSSGSGSGSTGISSGSSGAGSGGGERRAVSKPPA